MAQRFGGRYSPDKNAAAGTGPKPGPFQGARRNRAGGRVNLLFLAPIPLLFRAFTSEPMVMALYLLSFGALILAAWLTREGLKAEAAFEARKVARRPAMPRKIAGSCLTGIGLGLAGAAGFGAVEAGIFAVIGGVVHSFAFGLDPLRSKGMDDDHFQSDRVARAVDEAEAELAAMSEAAIRAGDRSVEARVEQFQATARALFRTVENDPRDLSAARKYLSVYLRGAREATSKFADLYARRKDPEALADYLALLDDLERNFAARTERLLLDDRTDLTVEIDVLRERLAREGIRAEKT
ncbi:5-bromo-4-chloroindolyl phosphate hydrolysis protein [Poseidonocella pacifica]|uniref:5-bromo-4-chloroindolyl phosphate hydrolysis protein n=1 Tax=Poseidonocella pacifica TaxID=871651 RepID=A0A1I0WES0_9RHOB|nr:5-bromo-4-chloroindolyl phosphate hydrolysis family protein [Poseidonocella pacifica]SFA87121.1 5-bromo-4-chloroindolyl phosphate hydrolysis protein [Poseidonocella pacifica]